MNYRLCHLSINCLRQKEHCLLIDGGNLVVVHDYSRPLEQAMLITRKQRSCGFRCVFIQRSSGFWLDVNPFWVQVLVKIAIVQPGNLNGTLYKIVLV